MNISAHAFAIYPIFGYSKEWENSFALPQKLDFEKRDFFVIFDRKVRRREVT